MHSFEGYVARRSAVLKRWKDRKLITVISGKFKVVAEHNYCTWGII